ncbi:WhiB family transcriptional regulator [Nonomuraea sp. SMC257]|uniref:WhiB family transcriptional regulator n=1 Tax=Nonomuraea montanisoli TaxID=2741721 RepID=A0A7Y6I8Z9_9ACTN|nr:WhiB family transcriptional regulator [Nonomuraea montanisoli]NUW33839.1 WhiB family transcriptional regulator [Nonomuraea montanisoli]
MTYGSIHSNGHPAHLSVEQLRKALRAKGATPVPECAYDPELHVGPRRSIETAEQRAAREQVAREVCAGCPTRRLCELYALRVRPSSGIWAGRAATEISKGVTELDELEVA